MKKLTILLVLILISVTSFGQAWTPKGLKVRNSEGTIVTVTGPEISSLKDVTGNLEERLADTLYIYDYVAPKHYEYNDQTGTTYTAVLSDDGKIIVMTNGSANTFTVPPESEVSFPDGTILHIIQGGAGQTTIVAGSGVTLNGDLSISAQYGWAEIVKHSGDVWYVTGRTE